MAKAAAAPAAAPAKKAKAPTKSEMMGNIATTTGLSKKQVADVLEALSGEIKKALSTKGPGVVQIPGLVKITKKKVPAQPARKGVMVLGQLRDLPAKPASVKIRVRALKNLKEMV
jgi:nucleoid DNA-binding protein